MARSPEEYEAELEQLRARIRDLESQTRAAMMAGTVVGRAPAGTRLTVHGLEEMVLLVAPDDTVAYMNAPMARLFAVADRKGAIGVPVANLGEAELGAGTLRGLVDLTRGSAECHAIERDCPSLPEERLPAWSGRRPEGEPVLRLTAEEMDGRVQIVVQDVTRLRWLERTFSRYVPGDVIDALERSPLDEHLSMTRKELTILFGDLRGFTKVSQTLDPSGVQELVNAFIELVGATIDDFGGTVVSWMGDGVMAVFGAPLFYEDHPVRGLVCAVELQRRHAEWSEKRKAEGLVAPELGLGVSSGEVVVGNVGSETRLSYTALGHTTNLTARLCAKAEGGQTLTTPQTHRAALATLKRFAGPIAVPRLSFEPRGKMVFKNVDAPIDVVSVTVKK